MTVLRPAGCHAFEAAGRRFLYLSQSAAVVGIDDVSSEVLDALTGRPRSREDVHAALDGRHSPGPVDEAIDELARVRAIETMAAPAPRRMLPLTPVPLGTLVMNVTNQCNLSCTYCYEYSEDRVVQTDNGRQPKWMSEETARASVDFLLAQSGPVAHLTFFGGETLLNFRVLQAAVAYASVEAAARGKRVDFSITTNATLLKPEVIDFLAAHDFGVTVSIDGPPDVQNRFRVFQNGEGSYDLVAPRIRDLIRKHRTRRVGARVTLTKDTLDIRRIYDHLTNELGFHEVGFAPATTSGARSYAIGSGGFDAVLEQFRQLAGEFREAAIENRHHGFSNVRETLEEIHKGANKAWPCGAGMGLLGVSTSGDVALCHRFAGSDDHRLGDVRGGLDRGAQARFLEAHHVAGKRECLACWARPLCAGGCYHEAYTRQGATTSPNLHYCDWIRGWTDTCLQIYGEIAVRNPEFLKQFEGPDEAPHAG